MSLLLLLPGAWVESSVPLPVPSGGGKLIWELEKDRKRERRKKKRRRELDEAIALWLLMREQ